MSKVSLMLRKTIQDTYYDPKYPGKDIPFSRITQWCDQGLFGESVLVGTDLLAYDPEHVQTGADALGLRRMRDKSMCGGPIGIKPPPIRLDHVNEELLARFSIRWAYLPDDILPTINNGIAHGKIGLMDVPSLLAMYGLSRKPGNVTPEFLESLMPGWNMEHSLSDAAKFFTKVSGSANYDPFKRRLHVNKWELYTGGFYVPIPPPMFAILDWIELFKWLGTSESIRGPFPLSHSLVEPFKKQMKRVLERYSGIFPNQIPAYETQVIKLRGYMIDFRKNQ